MTLAQIEQDVFDVTDINTLHRFQLDLSKQVSQIHRILSEQKDETKKMILKSNLSLAVELLDIVKSRVIDERNSSGKYNYQFRKEAESLLSKEMYRMIADRAAK